MRNELGRERVPEPEPLPPYEQGYRPIPAPTEPEQPKRKDVPIEPKEQNTEPVQIVHVHPVEVKHIIERIRPEQPATPAVPALPNPVRDTPIAATKPAVNPPEKSPDFIAQRIADHARPRNKIEEGDAIKPAANAPVPTPIRRQQKPLPVLKGRAGRVHSDEMVDDIMRTMLRDGKAPYGRARQQYNYRFHGRLADLADELIREGVPLHATFRNKGFWREWSGKTGKPLHASFYRKFA